MILEIQNLAKLCLAIPLGLSLMSCATPNPPVNAEVAVDEPSVSDDAMSAMPPLEVRRALIPTIDLDRGLDAEATPPRFDVTVDRAPARQFFMSLVEGTPYSIALAPGVSGEISLSLRDVTVEEVLDTLQQAHGFGYEQTSSGFLVLPTGLRTRIFRLDYLNLQRAGSSETRVSSGQISDQAGDGSSGGSDTSSFGGDSGASTSGSRIQTMSSSDLWEETVFAVRAIVGEGIGRAVQSSPNAGLIVVRALPAELTKVDQYLRKAESNLNRVVILEAKILEVTLNDGIQSGINWAQLATHNGDSLVVGQTGGGSVHNNGFSDSRGDSQDLGPVLENLFAGTVGSAFGGVFSLAIQADKFSAFIELLETQGSIRTLSNPRISTVNNQKAVIKVGQDEFFVTEVSTTTVTGTATTSSPNVTLTPFFSGIALDVTPQISESNDVILHVHPAVTQVVDQTKTFTIADELQELPLALSSIRETDSIVRAKSGQVVVIGGLIQNDSRDNEFGIPWISRIPFLGRLFEHSQVASNRTELVILLRPIVVGPETWGEELQATSSRFDEVWNKGRKSRDEELRIDGWLPPTPPVSHQRN